MYAMLPEASGLSHVKPPTACLAAPLQVPQAVVEQTGLKDDLLMRGGLYPILSARQAHYHEQGVCARATGWVLALGVRVAFLMLLGTSSISQTSVAGCSMMTVNMLRRKWLAVCVPQADAHEAFMFIVSRPG